MKKRKYPAVINKETGKWFTGYSEAYLIKPHDNDYYNRVYPLCEESEVHETAELHLKYHGYERGRSAANIIMVDVEGYLYKLSMSSFDKLMTSVDDSDSSICITTNGWFIGEFMQIKQGSNYFITVVGG